MEESGKADINNNLELGDIKTGVEQIKETTNDIEQFNKWEINTDINIWQWFNYVLNSNFVYYKSLSDIVLFIIVIISFLILIFRLVKKLILKEKYELFLKKVLIWLFWWITLWIILHYLFIYILYINMK